MDGRPKIEHVPLQPTLRMKALKHVLVEMDRKRPLRGRGFTVHRAGTATLRAATTQVREDAQTLKNLLHCHMSAQICEVDAGPRG